MVRQIFALLTLGASLVGLSGCGGSGGSAPTWSGFTNHSSSAVVLASGNASSFTGAWLMNYSSSRGRSAAYINLAQAQDGTINGTLAHQQFGADVLATVSGAVANGKTTLLAVNLRNRALAYSLTLTRTSDGFTINSLSGVDSKGEVVALNGIGKAFPGVSTKYAGRWKGYLNDEQFAVTTPQEATLDLYPDGNEGYIGRVIGKTISGSVQIKKSGSDLVAQVSAPFDTSTASTYTIVGVTSVDGTFAPQPCSYQLKLGTSVRPYSFGYDTTYQWQTTLAGIDNANRMVRYRFDLVNWETMSQSWGGTWLWQNAVTDKTDISAVSASLSSVDGKTYSGPFRAMFKHITSAANNHAIKIETNYVLEGELSGDFVGWEYLNLLRVVPDITSPTGFPPPMMMLQSTTLSSNFGGVTKFRMGFYPPDFRGGLTGSMPFTYGFDGTMPLVLPLESGAGNWKKLN